MAVLELETLNVEFVLPSGVQRALTDVSLQVRPGRIVGLVGETGSGKSVTIRAIAGLLRSPGKIASGRVMFDGTDLVGASLREMRRLRGAQISLIAQNPFGALNPVLSIRAQFANIIRAHEKAGRAEIERRALDALTAVRIHDPARVLAGYAHELSGGMAQRVVIAMALVLNPRLVLADEPTTALDLTTQRQILDLVRELIVSTDRAMVLVTHDMGVVAQYCDDVAVLYAGRVVEQGQVLDVLTAPRHRYTKALLESMPGAGRGARGIPGAVPSLGQRPPGCPFAPRCGAATDECHHSFPEPMVTQLAGDAGQRMVACFHPAVEGV